MSMNRPNTYADDMCSDNTAVREHQRQRRQVVNLEQQERANRIKSEYCDEIKKKRGPAVNTVIMGLYDTDRPLYNYIRNLENICGSVYCPKCSNLMPLPHLPGDLTSDVEAGLLNGYGIAVNGDKSDKSEKYKKRINDCMLVCDKLKFKTKMQESELELLKKRNDELQKKNVMLQEQLSALHDVSADTAVNKASAPVYQGMPSMPPGPTCQGMPTMPPGPTCQGMPTMPPGPTCQGMPAMPPSMFPGAWAMIPIWINQQPSQTQVSTQPEEAPSPAQVPMPTYVSEEDFNQRFARKDSRETPVDTFDLRTPLTSSVFFTDLD